MRGRSILLLTALLVSGVATCAQQANPVSQAGVQPAANASGAAPAAVAIPADPAYTKLESKLSDRAGLKRAQLLAQLAAMDYDAARAHYVAGDAVLGERLLERARAHAAQAYAIAQAQADEGKTKGMEKVEIPLHSIAYGLRGLAYDVSLVNRPPIQGAEAYFTDLRAHILELMFAPKTK